MLPRYPRPRRDLSRPRARGPTVDGENDRGAHTVANIFPQLGAVTRFVLFADFTVDVTLPTEADWRAECESVVGHGLSGIACRLIRERSIAVPSEILNALQESQFNDMALTARVVTMSQEGIRSLQSANIPFVITKGPGIALEAATLSDRPFIDLDIVVEPSRFVEARKVLEGIGYFEHSRTQQPWDSLNRFCREAVNLRTRVGCVWRYSHHRVSPWYWSTGLSQDVLVRDSRFSTLFGVPLRLVWTHHNLLIAALHVVSDKSSPGQTYRVWRDLLVFAHTC